MKDKLFYWANIDKNNVVENVICATQDFVDSQIDKPDYINCGEDNEKNASVGFTWDGNSFRSPQPYESWVWAGSYWEAPFPYPVDGYMHIWNESQKVWVRTT